MKNLSSKLFGGFAAAALVVGSFSMTSVKAAPVSINDIQVEASSDFNTSALASEWIITRNYVIVGNPTTTICE